MGGPAIIGGVAEADMRFSLRRFLVSTKAMTATNAGGDRRPRTSMTTTITNAIS